MYLFIYINAHTHTYIYILIIVDPAAGIEHILVGYHQPKIWILDGTKRTHMAISAPKPKPGDLIELVTIHIRS